MSPSPNGVNGHAASLPVCPTAQRRPIIESANAKYTEDAITASYEQQKNLVEVVDGKYTVKPYTKNYEFKTDRKVPKTG